MLGIAYTDLAQLGCRDLVMLRDKQTITDAMAAGKGPVAQSYRIDEIRQFTTDNGTLQLFFYHLVGIDLQPLWLVAACALTEPSLDRHDWTQPQEGAIELYLCFEPIAPGNRRDMLATGNARLFQDPGATTYRYTALEYSTDLPWNSDTAGPVSFTKESEFFGETELSGGLWFSQVLVYKTTEGENSTIFITELGGENSDTGGVITVLVGAPIVAADLDIL